MEQACVVARLYWLNFKELLHLMGEMDQLNLDIDSNILLEITGTPALRELMDASHLYWTLLVARKIASVTFSTDPVNIENLDNAVATIKEHNSKYNKRR